MYTNPGDTQEELSRRRKDKGLMKAVVEYLGDLPEGWPEDRAIATLNRYVATARIEDFVFAHAAASVGLRPYWPTYLEEKFTSTNPEKVSCLRPRVQRPKLQSTRNWLVRDHRRLEGCPFSSIAVGGASLQDMHDRARELVLPGDVAHNTFDISEWNRSQAVKFGGSLSEGRLAPHYYHAVMALYICHGVLFEDFDGGPNASNGLGTFVQEVLQPALWSATKQFGLAPLIVRLPYNPGFLDFPAACGEVFDEVRL